MGWFIIEPTLKKHNFGDEIVELLESLINDSLLKLLKHLK